MLSLLEMVGKDIIQPSKISNSLGGEGVFNLVLNKLC